MTLRVIDVETTGRDPVKDHIIEIASVDLTREGDITRPREMFCALPEGATIPPEVSAVHHIVADDLVDAKPLHHVLAHFEGADVYIAHNSEFEQAFLPAEQFPKFICTYKAALRFWPDAPGHSLSVLRYWRGHVRPFNKPRAEISPHRALSDVIVTAAIFHDLVRSGCPFKDMEAWSLEPALHKWCRWGKYKGKTFREIAQIDPRYLEWVIEKSEMGPDARFSAQHALDTHRQGVAA